MREMKSVPLGRCGVLLGILLAALAGGCEAKAEPAGDGTSADRARAESDLEYLKRESASGNPQAQLWLAYANMVSHRDWMTDGPFEWQALGEAHRRPWTAASNLVASDDFQGSGEDAWELLQQAMAAKEPRAIALFAKLLSSGGEGSWRTDKNADLALKTATIAAEHEDPFGRFVLVWLRLWGPERMRDEAEAVRQLEAMEGSGLALAEVAKGWIYALGTGYKQDGAKARQIAETWASQGSLEGKWLLFKCHFSGIGGPKDPERAIEICRELADRQHAQAMSFLGDCYLAGWGVEKDEAKAVECWMKAARDWPAAYRSIAQAYAAGRGVEKRPWFAWAMFFRAAAADDVADVDAWARKYREAKVDRSWIRSLRAVRVTARSRFDERTSAQLQAIAERVVRAQGLQIDPAAPVELAFHCYTSVSRDAGKLNIVSCVIEAKTHTPVLIGDTFINADVATHFALGATRQDVAPPLLNIDRAIRDQFQLSLKDMLTSNTSGESATEARLWERDLWPPEKDREMYCRWQAARAFGSTRIGAPLAGFTNMNVPVIVLGQWLRGHTDVTADRLELDWSGALQGYDVRYNRDAPSYIFYAAIGTRVPNGLKTPIWLLTTYNRFDRINTVVELPGGEFVRVSGGLVSAPDWVWCRDGMPSLALTKQIGKHGELIGPAIQEQTASPPTPEITLNPRGGAPTGD